MLDKQVLSCWAQTSERSEIQEVISGTVNSTYRIRSDETYYLRRFKHTNNHRIKDELRLLAELSSSLHFIVEPCLNVENLPITLWKGECFALYPEATGRQVYSDEFDCTYAFNAGYALANLHLAMETTTQRSFPTIELSWSQQNWLERLERIIRAINSIKEPEEVDLWALERAQTQIAYLASSRSQHEFQPNTKRILVHGDYHHYNLFFDKNKQVSGIIDWDLLQYMPPAYEIARACQYMFQLDVNKSKAFIEGYLSKKNLSLEEIRDGAFAWGIYADHHIWALEEVYFKHNLSAKKFIPFKQFEPFLSLWCPIEDAIFQ